MKSTISLLHILVIFFGFFLPDEVSAGFKWLFNDGFTGGDAYYQAGFVAGEIMAVRFDPLPGDYPLEIQQVMVFVGDSQGGGTQADFQLHIWEETGSVTPGTELYSVTCTLVADQSNMNVVPVNPPVTVNSGSFRIGLEFLSNPPPSFFRDADGTISNFHNFIYAVPGGWHYSYEFGLTGDWILRAGVYTMGIPPTVTPTGAPPTATSPPPPSPTNIPTNTPLPTWTQYPTESPNTPTHTPTPLFSQTPTSLPFTSTPAPTFTQAPTMTPPPGPVEVELEMPSQHFKAYDLCFLNATIHNPYNTIPDNRLIVALLLADGIWFWPSWESSLDSMPITIEQGANIVRIIDEFQWPAGSGSYSPVFFIGATTDEEYNDFTSMPDIYQFSFGP